MLFLEYGPHVHDLGGRRHIGTLELARQKGKHLVARLARLQAWRLLRRRCQCRDANAPPRLVDAVAYAFRELGISWALRHPAVAEMEQGSEGQPCGLSCG